MSYQNYDNLSVTQLATKPATDIDKKYVTILFHLICAGIAVRIL